MAFQPGAFQADAFQGADGAISGVLDVVFAPVFEVDFAGAVAVAGAVDVTFAPAFEVDFAGAVDVAGGLDGVFAPVFVLDFAGTSEGHPIVIPRNIAEGVDYLVEIEALDVAADEPLLLTYSGQGFTTLPTDSLPNRAFDPHVRVPGDYSRSMFGAGGTFGDLQVGAGVVTLINLDARLDGLADFAFDGRAITVKTVARMRPLYENAVTVFRGTMSHAEFTADEVRLVIRDRLAVLDRPIQETLYAGTTIAGGMGEAEGRPEDLKGRPKPLPFGAPLNVQAVLSNAFDRVYDLGEGGLNDILEVRDGGVLLTPSGSDHADLAALLAASIPPGHWGTCLATGQIRLGSEPNGQVTARPVKGATAADRTAAQLARRILLRMGLVEDVDFPADDIAALDALNSAEIGYWIGAEEQTALVALSRILNSIGATCGPDRLGVFRLYRLDDIAGDDFPVATFTAAEILREGDGLERLGTGDRGSGVPSWRITMNYGHNGAVMSAAELADEALSLSDPFRAFAGQEWRSVVAEDEAVKAAHLLSPELVFESYMIHEADAQAEADRRKTLYGRRRDRYRVPAKSYLAEPVDLNSVVALRVNRFGLSAGKRFRVIGLDENHEERETTLDVWG